MDCLSLGWRFVVLRKTELPLVRIAREVSGIARKVRFVPLPLLRARCPSEVAADSCVLVEGQLRQLACV